MSVGKMVAMMDDHWDLTMVGWMVSSMGAVSVVMSAVKMVALTVGKMVAMMD